MKPFPTRTVYTLLALALAGGAAAQTEFNARPTINVTGFGNVETEGNYVPNVVQAENGLASFEGLKAQAVAARTFAYYQMDNKGFIDDGTNDQVYSDGSPPRQIHLDAARATEGEILWVRDDIGFQQDVLIASFYVAGSIPDGPFDVDNPGIISEANDSDPTSTQQWVTFTYANGDVGGNNLGTPLGFQGTPTNPNWPNRGAKSQNGADYLSDNSLNYLDILKYYYGADIQVRTATTAGTGVQYGRKVLTDFDDYGSGRASDGIIDGHEGFFHRAPTFSGSTTANVAGSTADRDGAEAHEGSHSQRIDITYDEASGTDFLVRHVSGARYTDFGGSSNAAVRVANLQFESIGSVGFWLKTTDPGLRVSIALDDPETGDRGLSQPVIADGEWREYKWFLDNPGDWEAWVGAGNGQIDGVNVTLDSIQFFGASDATVFLDTVFWDPSDALDPEEVGDFNGDGVVDAIDFSVWSETEGSTTDLRADADGDSDVDSDDYTVWQRNLGRVITGGTSTAVPEPGALAIALVCLPMVASRRRRQAG